MAGEREGVDARPIVETSAKRFAEEYGRPKRSLSVAFGVGGADWLIFAYGERRSDIADLPRFFDGYEVRATVIGKVRALADTAYDGREGRDDG